MARTHDPPTPEEGTPMSEPSAGPDLGGPPPQSALAWSPALQQDMLDPAVWQEGLDTYARAMHLAMARVDVDGRLLGPCLKPPADVASAARTGSPRRHRVSVLPLSVYRTSISFGLSRERERQQNEYVEIHTSLFRLRALPAAFSGPTFSDGSAVDPCMRHGGWLLWWALEWLTTPLAPSPLNVWGQGRHSLLDHLA
jgi:hypothetical protein